MSYDNFLFVFFCFVNLEFGFPGHLDSRFELASVKLFGPFNVVVSSEGHPDTIYHREHTNRSELPFMSSFVFGNERYLDVPELFRPSSLFFKFVEEVGEIPQLVRRKVGKVRSVYLIQPFALFAAESVDDFAEVLRFNFGDVALFRFLEGV